MGHHLVLLRSACCPAAANGTDIDVIGYSYYPKFTTIRRHAPAIATARISTTPSQAYGKPVVIVETGFPSRVPQVASRDLRISMFPPTGQQQFLEALVDVVQNVPNDLGWGVFWWYPEARPTSGLNVWEGGRYGLFDQNGNLLPAASVFEQFIDPTLPGDYNSDGIVDAADYAVWRKTLGSTSDMRANGDNTGASMGVIDQADFDFWKANYGNALPGGAGSALSSRAGAVQRRAFSAGI